MSDHKIKVLEVQNPPSMHRANILLGVHKPECLMIPMKHKLFGDEVVFPTVQCSKMEKSSYLYMLHFYWVALNFTLKNSIDFSSWVSTASIPTIDTSVSTSNALSKFERFKMRVYVSFTRLKLSSCYVPHLNISCFIQFVMGVINKLSYEWTYDKMWIVFHWLRPSWTFYGVGNSS